MSNILLEVDLPQGQFTVYDDKPPLENIIHVNQTHSCQIEKYEHQDISHLQADGILVMRNFLKPNLHFAIKTADCMPVVFIGHYGVCIIHAGWVGVRDQILVHPMLQEIAPYYCFIGPSIRKEAFEVQEDFYQHFPQSHNFIKHKEKIYFDLLAEAKEQITQVFPSVLLNASLDCTFNVPKYNSYRRDKTSQRNWNIFSL